MLGKLLPSRWLPQPRPPLPARRSDALPAAAGYDRGYSEQKIENERYRISFKGNSMTGRETVENYLLFRAAELTLQTGYDTFTIVNRDTDKDRDVRRGGGYSARGFPTCTFPRAGAGSTPGTRSGLLAVAL